MLFRAFLSGMVGVALSGSVLAVSTGFAQSTDTWSLALSGPATARPGDEVVYVLRHSYSTTAPPSQVPYFFDIPHGTTFVSVSDTSGTDFAEVLVGSDSVPPNARDFAARTVGQANVQLTFIPNANDGRATVRLKIDAGASGTIGARARFGATGLGSSNEVATVIESARLPSTGEGGTGSAVAAAPGISLVLLGAGLMCAALGASVPVRRPR